MLWKTGAASPCQGGWPVSDRFQALSLFCTQLYNLIILSLSWSRAFFCLFGFFCFFFSSASFSSRGSQRDSTTPPFSSPPTRTHSLCGDSSLEEQMFHPWSLRLFPCTFISDAPLRAWVWSIQCLPLSPSYLPLKLCPCVRLFW